MSLFGKSFSGSAEYLIAGLGNPGQQYTFTRHNSGFLAIDYLSQQAGIKIDKLKYKSLCGFGEISGKKVMLLKPQTFMNNSGEAVLEAASFYKIPINKVIILSDDVSLPVGTLRIRKKGSDGGQKGLRSIIQLGGTDEFLRVKLGVGDKPNENWELADWVLSRFNESEQKIMFETFKRCAAAVEVMISGDIDLAMSKFNG